MTICKLDTKSVVKPWGRETILPCFETPKPGAPVGEIWFDGGGTGTVPDTDLLVKYLFTSERLSIQVHPDDALARVHGHACGKDEAWLILDADEDAVIGIGLVHDVSHDELRNAALDGSIEELLDWRAVKAGDYIYSPAGTVHAIGPGITMIEVQQKIDLTYRLYDYGRPRELHLDHGIEASIPAPFRGVTRSRQMAAGRVRLNQGPKFTVDRWTAGGGRIGATPRDAVTIVPISGHAMVGGERAEAGTCWIADEAFDLLVAGDVLLTAVNPATLG